MGLNKGSLLKLKCRKCGIEYKCLSNLYMVNACVCPNNCQNKVRMEGE